MKLASAWITAVFFVLSPSQSRALDASYLPPTPASELLPAADGGPDPAFCMDWNPEYAFRGFHCCPKKPARARRQAKCAPQRVKASYCDEMTDGQRRYAEAVKEGKVKDVLKLIESDLGRTREQAYCSVNNGFLAWGRQVIPTEGNRLKLRNPRRCVDFGTDGMVAMLEWVGRKIDQQYGAPEYDGVRLLVGDLSAPRGGCLSGRRGGRGHASHTTGQDADLGFLQVSKNRPEYFDRHFDPHHNLWLVKQIFANPYACVKVIFLDRRLIRKIDRIAGQDDEWKRLRRHVQHARGHGNHFHVRVGTAPGHPGCPVEPPSDEPESESGEMVELIES